MKRENLKNTVTIVGDLISKRVSRANVGKNDESISLTLTVRTGGKDEHEVNLFSYKYNMNENKERLSTNPVSKMFEGYETIANEYKSFLSVLVEDREEKARIEGTETDRVEIKGNLSVNRYVNREGKVIETAQIRGRFCTRIANDGSNDGASWGCHMNLKSITEKSDITGEYTLIKGIVVDYTEDEYEFRIYKDNIRKGFDSVFDEGESAYFEGNIVNRVDTAVEETQNESSWGEETQVSVQRKTITRRYLEMMRGDSYAMDTDDEEHPFSEVNVRKYTANIKEKRDKKLEEHKAKQTKESFSAISSDDIEPF